MMGSVQTLVAQPGRRWDFSICMANNACGGGQLYFLESSNTGNDTILKGTTTPYTTGNMYIFDNLLVSSEPWNALLGLEDGRCTLFQLTHFLCLWSIQMPDQENKLFLQAELSDEKSASSVIVLGGTGRYENSKGGGRVKPSYESDTDYLTAPLFDMEVLFGCNENDDYFTIEQNAPHYIAFPGIVMDGVQGSGVLTIWEDDNLTWTDNGTVNTNVFLRGDCTLLNDLSHQLCVWTFIFDSTFHTLTVTGTVVPQDDSIYNVAVAGGSGMWNGVRGIATYSSGLWSFNVTTSKLPQFVNGAPLLSLSLLPLIVFLTSLFFA
jgi:hypothetical protein